ncbi:MAG: metallophosphoesterase family protein [Alphaproteobacteria bacterium]
MEPCCDLGPLDGPVLAFGGPYGNLEATRALLSEARALGIPPDRTICTGDLVAYCGAPRETVAALRAAGVHCVMGNVEESLAADSGDCGCDYAAGSSCATLAEAWYAFARTALDAGDVRWLARLPRTLRFELGGRRFAVVHGAPSRINRWIFPSTPDDTLRAEIAASGCDGVVAGHSGIPFSRVVAGRLWHNAGVVGLPANDGTPRVWYGVLRAEADGIAVEHRPFGYDHESAAATLRTRGLPAGYADALETGRWPSLDILPPTERARTGIPLGAATLLWPADRPDAAIRQGRIVSR